MGESDQMRMAQEALLLEHVNLNIPDEKAARAFYLDCLGGVANPVSTNARQLHVNPSPLNSISFTASASWRTKQWSNLRYGAAKSSSGPPRSFLNCNSASSSNVQPSMPALSTTNCSVAVPGGTASGFDWLPRVSLRAYPGTQVGSVSSSPCPSSFIWCSQALRRCWSSFGVKFCAAAPSSKKDRWGRAALCVSWQVRSSSSKRMLMRVRAMRTIQRRRPVTMWHCTYTRMCFVKHSCELTLPD